MGAQEKEEEAAPLPGKKQQKSAKEVYFSILPDRYEPLIEEVEEEEEREETAEERRKRKEEKKRKKKKRYKKYRKVRRSDDL